MLYVNDFENADNHITLAFNGKFYINFNDFLFSSLSFSLVIWLPFLKFIR